MYFTSKVSGMEGDQIGRIFYYWAIDHFGHFLKSFSAVNKLWVTFSKILKVYVAFDKIWVGLHFGKFSSQRYLVTLVARTYI
jgi:hypothetical protein